MKEDKAAPDTMGLASDQHESVAQQNDDDEIQTPVSSSSSAASPKRMGSSTSKPVNSKKRAGQPYEIVVEVPVKGSSSAPKMQKSPSSRSEDAMSPTKKQRITPASPALAVPGSPLRNSRSNTPFQPAPNSVDRRVIHATTSLENLTTQTPSRNGQRTRAESRDRSVSPMSPFEAPVPSGQAYVLQDLPSSSQLTSLSRQQYSVQQNAQDVEMATDSEPEGDTTLDNIGQDDYLSMPPTSSQVRGPDGRSVTVTTKHRVASGSHVGTAPHRGVGRPKKSTVRSSPVASGRPDRACESGESPANQIQLSSPPETSTRRKVEAHMAKHGVKVSPAPTQTSVANGSKKPGKPRKSVPKSQDVDLSGIISNFGERSKRTTKAPVKYASEASSSDVAEEQLPKRKVKNGKGKAREKSQEREEDQLTDGVSAMSDHEASTAKRKTQPKKRKSGTPKVQAGKADAKKKREAEAPVSDTEDQFTAEPSEPEHDLDNEDSDEFSLKPTSTNKAKRPLAKKNDNKTTAHKTARQKVAVLAPAQSAAKPARPPLQRRSHSGSNEDETLPSLLPTSSFAKILAPPSWDLQLLDEAVFVALPGKLKKTQEMANEPSASDMQADVPKFWWPARILSRNRQNFRVKLVLDERKEEILKYTPLEPVIPQDQLTESGIVNLKDSITDEIRFSDMAAASETFMKHDLASAYMHPSDAAFKLAVRRGRQVPEDESSSSGENTKSSPKKPKPEKKRKSKVLKKQSNGSSDDDAEDSFSRQLVQGMFSSQTRVESDSEEEELDPEIEVGTCGLGRSDLRKAEWWPAKVVAIRSMEEVKNLLSQKSSSQVRKGARKTTKNGPYSVEFYPGESGQDPVFWLWREHFLLSTDADFKRVELGAMEERKLKDDVITSEELESVREPLQRLLRGEYPPGAVRTNLFFGPKTERGGLDFHVRYGDFTPAHVKQTSDYIQDLLETPDIEVQARISAFTEEEKIAFVTYVLLPLALELLVIHDGDLEERATMELEERGLPSNRESVEMKMHELAVDILEDKKDWFKKVLQWREMQNSAANVSKDIKVNKKEWLGYADTGTRTKKRLNYKE